VYTVLDTSFVIISTASASTQQFSFKAIKKNGNATAILSNQVVSLQPPSWMNGYHNAAVLNVFESLPYRQFSKDIAVESIQQDSLIAGNGAASLRARVRIKNKGTFPLSSFRLSCFLYPRVDCGGYYYQETFNVNVPPGDTLTVTTSFISRIIYSASGNMFCIYSSLPDNEADNYLADNELCITVLPVGISSPSDQRDITVLPNPFGSSLTVRDVEFRRIELADCMGRLILALNEPANRAEIDTEGLESGIYFVKVFTPDGLVIKKVIKP
jgi:hypothetical protein